jgi:anti-sigma B factor antagonist
MTQTEVKADQLIVRPEQDITATNVEALRAELQDLVAQGHTQLVIDLAGVGMIDSKGLAVFILCHKSVTAAGGSLTVVTDNADFRQLFHVMRMDEHFTVTSSL